MTMVPTPRARASAAPAGPLRLTKKVSSGSKDTSPMTRTLTVFAVSPGAKVSVPEAAA